MGLPRLPKGAKVFVECEIRHDRYTDNSGQERLYSKVVVATPQHELKLLDRLEQNEGLDEDLDFGPPGSPGGPLVLLRRRIADEHPTLPSPPPSDGCGVIVSRLSRSSGAARPTEPPSVSR